MASSGANHVMVGNLCGLFLLGTFTNIGIDASKILYQRCRTNAVNYYQLATFIAITLTCFSRVTLDSVRTVQTFTNPGPDGVIAYPTYTSAGTLATTCLWVIETAVADAFIAYRVWVIWEKRWWILVVPTLLLCGSVGGGFFLLYNVNAFGDTTPQVAFQHGNVATLIFIYFTLFLSVICTGLIASRIWYIRRAVAHGKIISGSDPIRKTLALIFESAAIYTALLLAIIVSVSVHSLLSYALFQLVSPTIAIVFSSIIVRSAEGRTEDGTPSAHPAYEFRNPRRTGVGTSSDNNVIQHRGVQIKLERVITQKVDGEDQVRYMQDPEDLDQDIDINSEKDNDSDNKIV